MIRVMVVEDEPPIGMSIKRIIENYNENIKVVYLAINGKRALEFLEKEEVDIIFTDIKMPVMDGLELAKNIKEKYSHISVVIISGFQEFEYAQKAIRYNVNEYLLKPISKNSIHEVLKKYYDFTMEQKATDKRKLIEETVNNSSSSIKLDNQEKCGVILCCFGPYKFATDEIIIKNEDNKLNEDIEKYATSILKDNESCICLNGKNYNEKIIVFSAETKEKINCFTKKIYEYLDENRQSITLVSYNESIVMANIKEIFVMLKEKLQESVKMFSSQMIFYNEQSYTLQEELIKVEFIKSLVSKNKDYIYENVKELVYIAMEEKIYQKNFLLYIEKKVLQHYVNILDISQLDEFRQEIEIAISNGENPDNLVNELTNIFYTWLEPEKSKDNSEYDAMCEEIAKYIKTNYKENISVIEIGKHFGVSPTTLSKKFKKYFGVSIPKYLNHFRIELARALMDDDSKKMVKEISLEVGYNDQYYFSKTFKKIVGVWPTEYSRNLQ